MTHTPDEICERLRRSVTDTTAFYPSPVYRNPDGPAAADLIQQQQATIERLSAALEPFDEAFGEDVDDDFGDDTPVVVTIGGRTRLYALTLGDFRRIRAALGKDASDV